MECAQPAISAKSHHEWHDLDHAKEPQTLAKLIDQHPKIDLVFRTLMLKQMHTWSYDAAASATPRSPLLGVYGTTARVLMSYGLFFLAGLLRSAEWTTRQQPKIHRVNAGRVMARILVAQGLFIKVGQLVSVLSNFLLAKFATSSKSFKIKFHLDRGRTSRVASRPSLGSPRMQSSPTSNGRRVAGAGASR